MAKNITAALAMVGFSLAGCAHTPDVTLGYYLPKSNVGFKVVRTVACDAGNNPVVATAVTPTVKHSADLSSHKTIVLSGLRGPLSDSDVKFEFYEDGRLSGVNASSTGQGEAILKTAITLASAVIGFDGGSLSFPTECADVKTFGGGKPLTLIFEGEIDLTKGPAVPQMLAPDTTSAFYAERLSSMLGGVCAYLSGSTTPQAPAKYTPVTGDVLLHLRQPGKANFRLTAGPKKGCDGNEIWNDAVPVAQLGTDYDLPIPAAAMFGKQQFSVGISESGAIKHVQYASNTGAGQLLNVGSAALTAIQGDTTAQKLAEVKAEADLIAQQQRLVACIADPASCK